MTIKLSETQKKTTIVNSGDVAKVMQQVLRRENKLGRAQEHFWVVGLNNVNKILFTELIALGQQNRVNANPPDVFRMAIYKLAVKLILVHNHPSGELTASNEDTAFTDRIIKVGELIDIDVLDHIIISDTDYLSFADEGIIQKLKNSDSWRIIAKEEWEMRELKQRLETEHKLTREFAKKLKATGMDLNMIRKVTGLTLSEIKNV